MLLLLLLLACYITEYTIFICNVSKLSNVKFENQFLSQVQYSELIGIFELVDNNLIVFIYTWNIRHPGCLNPSSVAIPKCFACLPTSNVRGI